MDSFTLKRTSKTIMGVFGTMLDKHGWIVCTTAERPSLNNQVDISCINAGEYKCVKFMSPERGYLVILILDVEGRTMVEMHIGNKPMIDSKGCILLGSGYGYWDGQPTITSSTSAFKKFMDLADDEFILTIQDVS